MRKILIEFLQNVSIFFSSSLSLLICSYVVVLLLLLRTTTTSDETKESTPKTSGEREDGFEGVDG